MPDLRAALRALFAAQPDATPDAIRAELDEARADADIERYQTAGLLPVDDVTVQAARALRKADPTALDTLLRAPRPLPVPAAEARPAATLGEAPDPIATAAAAAGVPYHVAAATGDAPA